MKTLPRTWPVSSSTTSSFAGKDPFVGAFTATAIVALATLKVSARLSWAKCISSPFLSDIKSSFKVSYYLASEKMKVSFHSREVLLEMFLEVLD